MNEQQLDAFEKLNHSQEEISFLARQHGHFIPVWPHSKPLFQWLESQPEFRCLVHSAQLQNTQDEELLDTLGEEQPHFVCPLSRCVMLEPVVWADGHSYEASFLQTWLEKHDTSPISRKQYFAKEIYPNRILKEMISEALDSKRKDQQAAAKASAHL